MKLSVQQGEQKPANAAKTRTYSVVLTGEREAQTDRQTWHWLCDVLAERSTSIFRQSASVGSMNCFMAAQEAAAPCIVRSSHADRSGDQQRHARVVWFSKQIKP